MNNSVACIPAMPHRYLDEYFRDLCPDFAHAVTRMYEDCETSHQDGWSLIPYLLRDVKRSFTICDRCLDCCEFLWSKYSEALESKINFRQRNPFSSDLNGVSQVNEFTLMFSPEFLSSLYRQRLTMLNASEELEIEYIKNRVYALDTLTRNDRYVSALKCLSEPESAEMKSVPLVLVPTDLASSGLALNC